MWNHKIIDFPYHNAKKLFHILSLAALITFEYKHYIQARKKTSLKIYFLIVLPMVRSESFPVFSSTSFTSFLWLAIWIVSCYWYLLMENVTSQTNRQQIPVVIFSHRASLTMWTNMKSFIPISQNNTRTIYLWSFGKYKS